MRSFLQVVFYLAVQQFWRMTSAYITRKPHISTVQKNAPHERRANCVFYEISQCHNGIGIQLENEPLYRTKWGYILHDLRVIK